MDIYADDTGLIKRSVTAMNKLLAKIKQCANYFGLNFNKTKCVSMNFHTNRKNRFANGDEVPTQEDRPYLGANISKRHDNKKEVSSRISSCFSTLARLQLFWKNNSCPAKFRLQVLDAVIRSQLVYGLESISLTQATINRINTFQLKGLRKILGLKTTFVERANSNKIVFELANNVANPRHKPEKGYQNFRNVCNHKTAKTISAYHPGGRIKPITQSHFHPTYCHTN